VLDMEKYATLTDPQRGLAEVLPLDGRSAERDGPAVRIEPGKEGDFAYIRGWLAGSEWLDRLIAATEPQGAGGIDPPCSTGPHPTGCTFLIAATPTATIDCQRSPGAARRIAVQQEMA
jgi:hypothetical protein